MTSTNPRFNYTANAWEGGRYDDSLSLSDITKKIKSELKAKYPDCVFSVSKESYSGGGNITIRLMAAKFDVFTTPDPVVAANIRTDRIMTVDDVMKNWNYTVSKGYSQLNHYYLDRDYTITDRTKMIMTDARKIANSFNFDDSDGMIDYFHTNFYLNLAIGKWDKAFVKIN